MSGRPLSQDAILWDSNRKKRDFFNCWGAVFKSREGWEQLKGRTETLGSIHGTKTKWKLSKPVHLKRGTTSQTAVLSFQFLPISTCWSDGLEAAWSFQTYHTATVIATQKSQHYQSSQVPCPWSMIRTGHLFFHPQTLPPHLYSLQQLLVRFSSTEYQQKP